MNRSVVPVTAVLICVALQNFANADASAPAQYGSEAREVMAYVQKTFWDSKSDLYKRSAADPKPDYIWRQAAAFSALVGAARHEPDIYRPLMAKHFAAMNSYWDAKAPIPGYEPAPTRGDGHDKYYDDNAWLVITFAEAYRLTGDRAYLTRADETARFVFSGSDDKLGGGIWWHEAHKDGTKNTCSNGPSAVGFLALARLEPPDDAARWNLAAGKTIDWTLAHLQAGDGLFEDRIVVATGEVKRGKLTYNSALMLRACLSLYHENHKPEYLAQAVRIGKAAGSLADKQTGVYRDPLKWSQFMAEADLSLYRETDEAYLLARVKKNADAWYAAWKKEPSPEMMSNAGTARILWLLADMETDAGKAFWKGEYGTGKEAAAENKFGESINMIVHKSNNKRKGTTARRSACAKETGKAILADLTEFAEAIETGIAVESKFVVRRVAGRTAVARIKR